MHPIDRAVEAAETAAPALGVRLTRQDLEALIVPAVAAAFEEEAARVRADVEHADATNGSRAVRECGPMLGEVLERAAQIYREGR